MVPLQELKERKLVQWALAYIAGAWVVLQVIDVIGGDFGWPDFVGQIATVLLGVGFLAALVLAWFHGEKGAQRVSGIEIGMLTGILVIAGVGVTWVRSSPESVAAEDVSRSGEASALSSELTRAEQGSIAVLPFENMSADPDNEYFSDGITEELLNVLAQLPELRVASRTSAFAFKGRDVGIDSIARALNVRHVLEGSVRRVDDQVRITAQLIDAESGYHMWSDTYDRELRDIFAVQDEIAREIVNRLQIELTGGEGPLVQVQTTDPEAHTLVLRGRRVVQMGSGEPSSWLLPAERLFEQAIARDSSYAAAWAGLANVHRLQQEAGLIPREDGLERAQAEAERALALDPDEGDAHLVLGAIAMLGGRDSEAGPHIEEALRANPGDARTLGFYALWLSREGRTEEALRVARQAVELDPLSVTALTTAGRVLRAAAELEGAVAMYERVLELVPEDQYALAEIGMTRTLLGEREGALEMAGGMVEIAPGSPAMVAQAAWIHAYSRDFERAVELFRSAVELNPDDPTLIAYLANALVMVEGHEEASALAERAVELAPESAYLRTVQAYVYADAGRREAAERALGALPEDEFLSRAAVRAALGETDRAFALLDRAVEAGEDGLAELGVDWWFDNLRSDPRMDRLLERVGVPKVVHLAQTS